LREPHDCSFSSSFLSCLSSLSYCLFIYSVIALLNPSTRSSISWSVGACGVPSPCLCDVDILKFIQYVAIGGGSNPNGLFCDRSGGNSTGVWGWVWNGEVTSQFAWGSALLIPKRLALKKSGAGSPSEYVEVGVGQQEDGDGAFDWVNLCSDTLVTICK
jgi:hypothetical protein